MILPETFARYAMMRVPRYTSYPTAPNFSQAVDEGEYRNWLSTAKAGPVSVYLHIPFCREMCWYCGCHTTVTRRQAPVARYSSTLVKEIELVAANCPQLLEIGHVHWGGGSPTLLSANDVERIHRALKEHFSFLPLFESAIEIDPRTLTSELVAAFSRAGVHRASIGVQSFDPRVQSAINRVQSFETTAAAVRMLRDRGIPAINLDLVYGLPCQSVDSCLDTLDQALSLQPDRLAVFGYAHIPSFKAHQRRIDEAQLPGPAERSEQAEAIARTLTARGYRQVGLDHFALPGDSLALAADCGKLRRNFQGYTTDSAQTLLGFGASAIGRLERGFVQNATRIPDYERRIGAGQLATIRGCPTEEEDNRRGAIIEQLMCNYRAHIGSLDAPLDQLVEDGLIRCFGDLVEVVDEARPLVRAVAAAFDERLQSSARHATVL